MSQNALLADIRKSLLQNSLDLEDTLLHQASYSGEKDKLIALLKTEKGRSKVNQKNRLGCTPLRLAATAGHTDCVDFLLRCGAIIDSVDVKGQTPLYVAVKNKHISCIKLLLNAGAKPNGDMQCMCSPLYSASFAGYLPALQELIRHGADMNSSQRTVESFVSTPLQICLVYQHIDCFRELLLAGADPDFHLKQSMSTKSISAVTGKVSSRKTNTTSLYHVAISYIVDVQFAEMLHMFGAGLYHRDSKNQLPCDLESNNACSAYIKTLYDTPQSLLQMCRISVRKQLNELNSLQHLHRLPLPNALINYLAHY